MWAHLADLLPSSHSRSRFSRFRAVSAFFARQGDPVPSVRDGQTRQQQHASLGGEVPPFQNLGDRGKQGSGGAFGRDGEHGKHAQLDFYRAAGNRQNDQHSVSGAHVTRRRVQRRGVGAERIGWPRHRCGAEQNQDVRAEKRFVLCLAFPNPVTVLSLTLVTVVHTSRRTRLTLCFPYRK